ncbi:MAG: PAC2 family protein [Thermodesulfovibrio sp.]|nr:PAC2 family protein [Thermodesulfovibrio sp.]
MSLIYYFEPKLKNPVLVAAWPGMGNVGLIAVENLRVQLQAEEFAEIKSWEFFYPNRVLIQDGELKELIFPSNKFYYSHLPQQDIIIFIGYEQSMQEGRRYAEGEPAQRLAETILEVAQKFECNRIYTSGAAAEPIHHKDNPRVVVTATESYLIEEMIKYPNVISISQKRETSTVVGLSGILLGIAKNYGIEGVCLMGEIPLYLTEFVWSYPKASKSVLAVFSQILSVNLDLTVFDRKIIEIENKIEEFLREIKEKLISETDIPESLINWLDWALSYQPEKVEPMSEQDKINLFREIDDFLKKQKDK